MTRRELFSFPNPVNEVSARVVAGGVVAMVAATLLLRRPWLILPIAYGFVARVLTGPTLSPLGQLATRVITPNLPVEDKPVPGPPKRFAQGIGAACSVTAVVLAFGFRRRGAAYTLLGMIGFFAVLESVFAFCVGCKMFGLLMRAGVIPESVCEECTPRWVHAHQAERTDPAQGAAPPVPPAVNETVRGGETAGASLIASA